MNSSDPQLVLASTSPYRRELLQRLGLPFEVASPDVDESPLPGESPSATADRLAEAKARAVAPRFPRALIIGSDQVAHLDGRVFGKPGTRERAVEQLAAQSARTVTFYTALCLYNCAVDRTHVLGIPVEVRFRRLGEEDIRRVSAWYADYCQERPLTVHPIRLLRPARGGDEPAGGSYPGYKDTLAGHGYG